MIKHKKKAISFQDMICRYKQMPIYATCSIATKKEKDSTIANHLLPEFGTMKLKNIDTADITAFLTKLSNKGKIIGGRPKDTLSTTTQYNIWLLLRQVLDTAVKMHYIQSNPCDGVLRSIIPKVDYKEAVTYSSAGLAAFLNDVLMQKYLASKAKNALITWLIISTGKGCKDIYQLHWQDIDFSSNSINNEKVDDVTIGLLEAHKFFQDNWLQAHTNVTNPDDLVFIAGRKTDVMHAPSPGTYYQWLKKNAIKWGYTPVNVRSLQKMSAENNIFFKKDAKLLYLVLNKELMEYKVSSVYDE